MKTNEINDRAKHQGDCYIITGSIGPQFKPKLYKRHSSALRYAREILAYGRCHRVHPAFMPVVEDRWRQDMRGMTLDD